MSMHFGLEVEVVILEDLKGVVGRCLPSKEFLHTGSQRSIICSFAQSSSPFSFHESREKTDCNR